MSHPRQGIRLGVDVGTVRIGVARCDPGGVIATPLTTVRRGRGDLERIAELVADDDAVEVVVGLPTSMSGRAGPAARATREFAGLLAARVAPVPVRLVDERLTTVAAGHVLRERGMAGRAQRKVVDQTAAAILLQAALDAERVTGAAPGEVVPVEL